MATVTSTSIGPTVVIATAETSDPGGSPRGSLGTASDGTASLGTTVDLDPDPEGQHELHTMSMRLVSGGTYNVRASEMAAHLQDRQPKTVQCIVHFLDDSEEQFEIDKRAKAQHLLDKVFDHLELVEKDYFGLQFVDLSPAPDHMVGHNYMAPSTYALRWLDPLKTIKKQCRGPPFQFFFRVKFYVSDPSKLSEEYTRYHFFLQVKRDILEGRLVCPPSTAALLASYAVQSELGDYNPEEHRDNYLTEYRFLPTQTEEFEKQVSEQHKQHRGQTPADAEYNYLDKAKRLEMYGVDLHNARSMSMMTGDIEQEPAFNIDQSNIDIQLGVTSIGLVVFQNNVKINTFPWAKIVKISFKRKQFFIQLRREVNDAVENLIGFNMVSYRSCKNLWKSCVEHHTFFRLYVPNPPTKKIFSIGSKFRYSGKTEFQTLEESKRRTKMDRSFSRSPSKKFARRTVGGHTTKVIMEERNFIDGHRNIPKSQTFSGLSSDGSRTIPASSNHSFNRHDSVNNQMRATLPHDYKVGSSARGSVHSEKSDDDGGFLTHNANKDNYPQPIPTKNVNFPATDNQIKDVTNHTDPDNQLPAYNDYLPNGNGYPEGHGLVTIRMNPDEQGRFGFNVKGGADQGMPIIVSRVAPSTPADLAFPRLNEGDQVLVINGRDVSQHTHEQVVMFIRASRETHSGELVLIVRPNVYVSEDTPEEYFEYLPENHMITTTAGANALEASLLLLQESLESGAALAQFEQLYRKKPGMTMNAARLEANIPKNRYRDISPYDQTRVMLKSGGEYINANYVNMEIPGSGIVNRYIAAQGPLPNTCVDFWQMVWEQHSSLVVMLTTKIERGRVKCHQYWPDLYETVDYGELQITCVKEEDTTSFAFREFNLTHLSTNEERHISHMQYIAWPDHGVPDDPADFLDFVGKVRQKRTGMVEPTIVHCSAGIGRTGVLITMETAMCLIESNQPVYPLSIVRQMRDQRAMLIQTPSQYKFVCEAILKVSHDQLVKPMEDYQR
ncbi:tyrosine-protein phosphatase non-receptor type 4-like isoform X1 [Argopecten irradians]|uniref:tyrosine-protein phosphatase non-receptor type 4-like isoform X1 n=2 Tax=Argopecten irradians TaxID=31199 RepID=UPI0037209B44